MVVRALPTEYRLAVRDGSLASPRRRCGYGLGSGLASALELS